MIRRSATGKIFENFFSKRISVREPSSNASRRASRLASQVAFFRGAARDESKKGLFFRRKSLSRQRSVFLPSTTNEALTSRDQESSSAENAP
jgi:hypothetical protein